MSNLETIIFEDIFDVQKIDPEGKKFDKVSRLVCRGENFEMDLVLDVNVDIYPVEVKEKFSIALARTIKLDKTPTDDHYSPIEEKTLLDSYDYAMSGKVFRYIEHPKENPPMVSVYASYGGLLMELKGDPRHLKEFRVDLSLFLLMKKL